MATVALPGGRGFSNFSLDSVRDYVRQMHLLDELVKAARLPEKDRRQACDAVAEKARTEADFLTQGAGVGHLVGVAESFQQTQAHVRCAVVGIAAERYRLKNGHRPHKMNDLVKAGLLKMLKNPLDGQPLRLKATPTGIVIEVPGPHRIQFELWRPDLRGQ